uniref:Uncharacterized protein n=1 Tax=Aegilops tauschii subsp. strangulata TaxID=200361 RepID=A0A453MVN7_AEGTS
SLSSADRSGRPRLTPAGSRPRRGRSRGVRGAATPWLRGARPDARETIPSQEKHQDDRSSSPSRAR